MTSHLVFSFILHVGGAYKRQLMNMRLDFFKRGYDESNRAQDEYDLIAWMNK